ncbi:glyoxylate reductase [Saccharopolyspora subtropica]|uniref:2-hydroxyacid dehydrogenase n=1 Tax=Saccharopolyspora thermophila TaxID=89367 RepID=A0A917JQV0_9PSEU|nr:D-isomer specific 2-hydroxyacid dehydrogenase family protein [Saccharopolyspora subtropica]GGI80614.1 glyoxylate reductase [Saccharopolyspora subtropica]
MNSVPRRAALMAMSREEVPPDLRDRVERAVRPIWDPRWTARHGTRPDVEILVTAHTDTDLTPEHLAALPGLRTILTTSTAVDYIDSTYCRQRGVSLHNTPDYTGSSVAEHAIALMLAVLRHIPRLDTAARSGADTTSLVARELSGMVAGVVGLGGIGTRIGNLVRGLGMSLVYVNRSRREHPGARQVDLPDLLAAADVVFLSLPLAAGAGPLLGPAEFAVMKPSAVVVNISADGLIDRTALAAALTEGRIAGAGLDVIGDPARYADLPNTVLTPRHAWYTREAVRRRAQTWVDTLQGLVEGREVHRVL